MKKIIPAIDMKNGKVVKSIRFQDTKEVGDDPVAFAKKYFEDGADELCVLDIMASIEGRKTKLEIINRMREEINIPICVFRPEKTHIITGLNQTPIYARFLKT